MSMDSLDDLGLTKPIVVVAMAVVLTTTGVASTLAPSEDGTTGVETANAGAAEPFGVHLGWTTDNTSKLTVTWFTDGLDDPGNVVQYADSCDEVLNGEPSEATGANYSLPGVDVLGHEATMTGLAAETIICYRVGAPGAWSETFEAKTKPEPGEPFKFVHCGDMARSARAVAVSRDIRGGIMNQVFNEDGEVVGTDGIDPNGLDVMMFAGDFAYAGGDLEEWLEWAEITEAYAAHIPTIASAGNHEWNDVEGDDPDVGQTYRAFKEMFALPGNELYYGVDVGNMHVTAFPSHSSGMHFQPTTGPGVNFTDMVSFMRNDLQQAVEKRDNGEIDFISVIQHHPMYSSEDSASRQYQAHLVPWEEPMLQRFDVDFEIGAHNHFYERTFPIVGSMPTTTEDKSTYEDPEGFFQVTNGGCGNDLYEFKREPFYPFTADGDERHNRVIWTVGDNEVHIESKSSVFITNETLDEFRVVKTDDSIGPDEGEPQDAIPGVDQLEANTAE